MQQYSWIFGETPKFTMKHSFPLKKDEKEIPMVSINFTIYSCMYKENIICVAITH